MYYNNESIVFFNGDFVNVRETKVSPYNQTLNYGNGVFEGMRSYDTEDGSRIFKAIEHYDRLHYSAKKMHMHLDYSSKELESLTYKLLILNNLKSAYIRPLLVGDDFMGLTPSPKTNLFIMAWAWDNLLGSDLLRVTMSPYQRPNPKSTHVEAKVVGHYTNSILASNEAKNRGFDEALLTDMNGFLAEAPGANLFIEKDNCIYTPKSGNILPGITRATIIELCNELNFPIIEKDLTEDDLKNADTAFFCGTAVEVVGIKSIDDHEFKTNWEETLSHQLQRAYKKRVAYNEHKNMFL